MLYNEMHINTVSYSMLLWSMLIENWTQERYFVIKMTTVDVIIMVWCQCLGPNDFCIVLLMPSLLVVKRKQRLTQLLAACQNKAQYTTVLETFKGTGMHFRFFAFVKNALKFIIISWWLISGWFSVLCKGYYSKLRSIHPMAPWIKLSSVCMFVVAGVLLEAVKFQMSMMKILV